MNTKKALFLAIFTSLAQIASAFNNIDANSTREATGFSDVTIIPLILLVFFLGILWFA